MIDQKIDSEQKVDTQAVGPGTDGEIEFQDPFLEAIKKNNEKKKRLEEERRKANAGVTRSYGLKR